MSSIEDRITKLEHAVFGKNAEPGRDEWQTTVGMFRGDPVMKEILDDMQEERERERQEARQRTDDNE
ncbi:hypothetical protein SH139x_001998 [Planctomycetaceae bacterium SH139]|jgi:hypothetical protein